MSESHTPIQTSAELQSFGSAPSSADPASTAALSNARSTLEWIFSFPAMLGIFLVGRVFYEARDFVVDPDLWWHVRVGQDILASHHWATVDPYSYTVAGDPWMAYEWLGDVFIGTAAKLGGIVGLAFLLFVSASAVMLALYAYTTRRAENCKAGFVVSVILCSLAFATFNLRPQMFGYLFIVLTLIVLDRFRTGEHRALYVLPPLFLMWINTHGSWVIGLGIMLVFFGSGLVPLKLGNVESRVWSQQERIRLEIVFLLSLAVIPITPYGTRLAAYPFTVASSLPLNVANISEWLPMPFNMGGGKLFLAVVLAFFLAQLLLPLRLWLDDVILLFGGIVMACLHVRFLMLFVPFAAGVLAIVVARWMPPYDRKKDLFFLNAALMAACVFGMTRYFPSSADLEKIAAKSFPVEAVAYLREHPAPQPMYNTYVYGGYLVGNLPGQKVFIDGRGDLYEDAGIFGEYLEVSDLKPGAFTILRAHNIQSCLLDRKEPLATALGANPAWEMRYSDGVSALYVLRGTTTP
jgi:hypothetical protein